MAATAALAMAATTAAERGLFALSHHATFSV